MDVWEKARAYDAIIEAQKTPEQRMAERYRGGAAMPGESCDQRNMRMGWGCGCHGATFCPDLKFAGYDNDVPVFVKR